MTFRPLITLVLAAAPALVTVACAGAHEASASGGAGTGGENGDDDAPACPSAASALGRACRDFGEGFACVGSSVGPCDFGRVIVCRGGRWQGQESFPVPCNGVGSK